MIRARRLGVLMLESQLGLIVLVLGLYNVLQH